MVLHSLVPRLGEEPGYEARYCIYEGRDRIRGTIRTDQFRTGFNVLYWLGRGIRETSSSVAKCVHIQPTLALHALSHGSHEQVSLQETASSCNSPFFLHQVLPLMEVHPRLGIGWKTSCVVSNFA